MEKILNYIDGILVEPLEKKYLDNINPSRGKVYSLIPDSNEKDVALAISAAAKAHPMWSQSSVEVRSSFLKKLSVAIENNLEQLALAETIDNGKPITTSRQVDIPRSKLNFEFFADCLLRFHGEVFETQNNASNKVSYSPLGVVACISPWNLPLYLFTWKIAPALAAGNTVVAKPSEVTPMTAYLLSKLCIEIGLPPGVLNIVHGTGSGVGTPLVTAREIKAVSFTGSTVTGRAIAQATAGSFKKLSLEMGGKNPNIIFSDCDFDKALETTVRSSFANQGQICLCGSRIFIEKSLYSKFRDALVEKTKCLRMGDPLEANTEQGALVSKAHMNKILSYLDLAKKDGGKILTGGSRANMTGDIKEGYFVLPTLIEGLNFDHELNQEEIFGPVATLIPFNDENELLDMANSTRFGLSASIWSQDLNKASRIANKLDSGIVWINTWMVRDLRTPFGGMKESGVGREGGFEALKFFSETKNICISTEIK
ncbi:MAG: aldehyde dehydrogenase [Oligoflexia bacterium]|nr:aldehyde dehydrogenase [Oligoflexia bacterium]